MATTKGQEWLYKAIVTPLLLLLLLLKVPVTITVTPRQ